MLITFLTHQNPFEMIFLYKMEKFCLFISIECAIRSTTYQNWPKVALEPNPFWVSVITAPFLKLSSSLCDPLKLYMAFTRITPATPDILKHGWARTVGVVRAQVTHTSLCHPCVYLRLALSGDSLPSFSQHREAMPSQESFQVKICTIMYISAGARRPRWAAFTQDWCSWPWPMGDLSSTL